MSLFKLFGGVFEVDRLCGVACRDNGLGIRDCLCHFKAAFNRHDAELGLFGLFESRVKLGQIVLSLGGSLNIKNVGGLGLDGDASVHEIVAVCGDRCGAGGKAYLIGVVLV